EGRDPVEANRSFGSRLRTHEAVRDAIVSTWLDSLLADSRFGLRQLWKNKRTAAAAILSLGLAMGASMESFNYPGFRLLRAAVKDQAAMMAISYPNRINLTYGSDEDMERVYLQYVS